jgi:hypothetical protein
MVLIPWPEIVPLLDENIFGNTRITQVFSVGKHEQMIPMLTSRLLQSAAMGLSQLMSSETETAYSDCRRNSEIMQVTPPRQNTKVKASFCARGKFNVLMTGRGRTATAMSVTMFNAALVNLIKGQYWVISVRWGSTNHTTSRFKQVPLAFGSMPRSQK